jgi:hypothetical protein
VTDLADKAIASGLPGAIRVVLLRSGEPRTKHKETDSEMLHAILLRGERMHAHCQNVNSG